MCEVDVPREEDSRLFGFSRHWILAAPGYAIVRIAIDSELSVRKGWFVETCGSAFRLLFHNSKTLILKGGIEHGASGFLAEKTMGRKSIVSRGRCVEGQPMRFYWGVFKLSLFQGMTPGYYELSSETGNPHKGVGGVRSLLLLYIRIYVCK
jgi:hypothetical protein